MASVRVCCGRKEVSSLEAEREYKNVGAHLIATGEDGQVRHENDELLHHVLLETEDSRMARLHEDAEDGESRNEAEDSSPSVVQKVVYGRAEGFEEVGKVSKSELGLNEGRFGGRRRST